MATWILLFDRLILSSDGNLIFSFLEQLCLVMTINKGVLTLHFSDQCFIWMFLYWRLYWITKRAGERANSRLMKANAWHHRADAVSSVVALIGVGNFHSPLFLFVFFSLVFLFPSTPLLNHLACLHDLFYDYGLPFEIRRVHTWSEVPWSFGRTSCLWHDPKNWTWNWLWKVTLHI